MFLTTSCFCRCKQPASIVVEMDRILRPGGWAIIRDKVEILDPLEGILKSLHWDIRMTYAQQKEGILCAQKTTWRPWDRNALPHPWMQRPSFRYQDGHMGCTYIMWLAIFWSLEPIPRFLLMLHFFDWNTWDPIFIFLTNTWCKGWGWWGCEWVFITSIGIIYIFVPILSFSDDSTPFFV